MGTNVERRFANLNKHLLKFENDNLYHLNMEKNKNNLKALFGDVKFVCMGGSSKRMQQFAFYMRDLLDYRIPSGTPIYDLTGSGDRYSMYKLGPILFVSHGIGCPSLAVVLNEIVKLIYYAGCDAIFFRVGTCGGLDIHPGTIVITEEAVDGLFRPEYRQFVLGRELIRESKCDKLIINELVQIGEKLVEKLNLKIVKGKTMCANDFYEDQGRTDGVFCDYSDEDKLKFLNLCKENGIINMEMESLCFSALLNHANIKFAIVCVSLLDRLVDDQVRMSHEDLLEFQHRPFKLVGEYIKIHLK